MSKVYIRDYSRKELAVLLEECFYILGKSTANLDQFHIETMLNNVLKYNSNMWYDSFKEAFEMAIDLNVDTYGTPSPAMIFRVMKAYKNKDGVNVRTQKNENPSPHGLPPATDKDYYETLICIMEGKRSERHKLAFPHISDEQHLEGFRKHGQLIPITYDWEAVYRYLFETNQVDASKDMKGQVMIWLSIKYPNAKEQAKMFKDSPMLGTSLGQKVRQTLLV